MLYAAQIQAARVLLGWRQEDLARASKVGLVTIYRIERQEGIALGAVATMLRLQQALEKAGIKFWIQMRMAAPACGGSGRRRRNARDPETSCAACTMLRAFVDDTLSGRPEYARLTRHRGPDDSG